MPDFTRRDFIRLGLAGAACTCLPARAFGWGAFERLRPDGGDTVLVLLQLSGGNDGLSTVVPYGDDVYHRSRKATLIAAKDALPLDDYAGLHPRLTGLKTLYDAGSVAVIQGAGYPNPNRSHFESMDIWHAADPKGRASGSGWIGRYADGVPDDGASPNMVIHVGKQIPYALYARKRRAIGFETPESYRFMGTPDQARALEMASSRPSAHAGRDDALDRMRKTLIEAQASSKEVREAAARYQPRAEYARTGLATSLRTVAGLIAGGLDTRVYSVEMGGFDTHVNQKAVHDGLMAQFGDAVAAFMKDLAAQGLANRVLIVAFSEFGRRLAENGSNGTDHGVAGPMFAIGGKVKGGLYSKYPSLTDLDRGDLKHTVDFRSVYATAIDRWLGGRHQDVLGKSYKPVDFL